MKTTVDIPESELNDAMRFLGVKTKREAIITAIAELNQKHRTAALISYSGTCDFDSNEEIEDSDAE